MGYAAITGGGGKVTTEGLVPENVAYGKQITVKQGNKVIEDVTGTFRKFYLTAIYGNAAGNYAYIMTTFTKGIFLECFDTTFEKAAGKKSDWYYWQQLINVSNFTNTITAKRKVKVVARNTWKDMRIGGTCGLTVPPDGEASAICEVGQTITFIGKEQGAYADFEFEILD